MSYGYFSELELLLDNLVEKKYQLRLEHNHSDMNWYAYYAGRAGRSLFDDDIDWETGSDNPLEAVAKLNDLVATGRIVTNSSSNPPTPTNEPYKER